MDNIGNYNDLQFEVNSVSEVEYKINQFSALSKEEINNLGKNDQVLLTDADDMSSTFPTLVVYAPSVWFADENDMMERVCGDLKDYIIEAVDLLFTRSVKSIGRLVDLIGVQSLMSYCSNDIELCNDGSCSIDPDNLDDIILAARKAIKVASLAVEISKDPRNNFRNWIYSAMVFKGMLNINRDEDDTEGNRVFQTFALKIPLFDMKIETKDYGYVLLDIYDFYNKGAKINWGN